MTMPDDLNLYAAPRDVEPVPAADQTTIPPALRGPSLGLLLLSGSMLLGIPFFLLVLCMQAVSIVHQITLGLDPATELPSSDELLGFTVGLVCIASSSFVFHGALCMRKGTNYRAASIAAILSCVPVLSPLLYCGIPLGIWALIVLRRPEVRAAFQT